MSSRRPDHYQAPALDKGLDILEYLADVVVPQSQAEIAIGLGRRPQEIYRMLARLHARGYLLRDEISSKYELSLKLFLLSRSHSPVETLARVARPLMRRLAEGLKQSCHLSVLYGEKLLVICHARTQLPVTLSVAEGASFDPLRTASGKLLFGVMPAQEQQDALNQQNLWRRLTATKRAKMRQVFALASAKQSLILASDTTPGVTDVAVLVGRSTGPLRACLTLSCIGSSAETIKHDTRLLFAAKASAKEINALIGISK